MIHLLFDNIVCEISERFLAILFTNCRKKERRAEAATIKTAVESQALALAVSKCDSLVFLMDNQVSCIH